MDKWNLAYEWDWPRTSLMPILLESFKRFALGELYIPKIPNFDDFGGLKPTLRTLWGLRKRTWDSQLSQRQILQESLKRFALWGFMGKFVPKFQILTCFETLNPHCFNYKKINFDVEEPTVGPLPHAKLHFYRCGGFGFIAPKVNIGLLIAYLGNYYFLLTAMSTVTSMELFRPMAHRNDLMASNITTWRSLDSKTWVLLTLRREAQFYYTVGK